MATIATTTGANPMRYPNQAHMDKLTVSGGQYPHFYFCAQLSATTYQMYHSTDGGSSWTTTDGVQTRTGLQELGPMVAANDNCGYQIYRVSESNLDKIYVRRFPFPTQVWESEKLLGSIGNGGSAGSVWSGLGMHVANPSGGVAQILAAVGHQNGSLQGAKMMGGQFSGSTFTQPTMFLGTSQWTPDTASGRVGPSVSTEHTGDFHTAPTPHLWLCFGRTNLYMVKLAWSGGQWTGPSSPTLIKAGLTAQDGLRGVFDGARWLMAAPNPDAGQTDTVDVWERNKANSTTTRRTSPPHTQGVIRNCSLSYDPSSGNFRVFAVGTGTDDLYFVDYGRVTDTWGSWATVSTTDVSGIAEWGVRIGTANDTKYSVYRRSETGASDTMTHDLQGLVFAPVAPQWVAPAASGQAADVASTLLLDWDFLDPDPADVQSAWALSRQIGVAAIAYFRASDSTWQATEQKNVSATTSRTLAASWGSGSDANHTYRVKTWDSTDQASAYSDAMVVVPSTVVNPTITSPTAAQVLGTQTWTVTWTVSEQTAFRLTLTETSPASALRYDTGWVTAPVTTLSHLMAYTLEDSAAYTVTLQTRNNEGLESVEQTRSFTVAYLGPDAPTLVATPSTTDGWIGVAITNPTPTGGRPAVATNDLWRRQTSVGGLGMRIAAGLAPSATHNDWKAVAGVAYEYQVVAFGVNGPATTGAWTA